MRWLALVLLVGCGRVGFDAPLGDGGGPGSTSTAFGEAGWTLDPGAQIANGEVDIDARGGRWSMTAPLGAESALAVSAVVTAIGTASDQHFSIEFVQGTAAYACEVARSGTSANLRWANTTNGIDYTHQAFAGVGGVYVGETFTIDVTRNTSVTCAMTTSDGGGSLSGQEMGVVADHVRLVAVDVQIRFVAFTHN